MKNMDSFTNILDDKYTMSLDQNIFVAKRNIIDYIWKSANLEGIAVTFPQTEAIYEGLSVQGLKVTDIIAVNNLKRSWDFLLSTLDYPTDFNLICKFNSIVGADGSVFNAGVIRKLPVKMGGTSWCPKIPDEFEFKPKINRILDSNLITDSAVELMLYCMRAQLFMDGNKRSSMLAANHRMIRNGKGVISINIEDQYEFRGLLLDFYETNNTNKIKRFIYDRCIDGMPFDN